MMEDPGRDEQDYQKWFEHHPWVFGTEYLDRLPARQIDIESKVDIVLLSADGYVDVFELKKPSPEHIVNQYILRWNIEVTFQEARLHLGVETQRQWTRRAIERTTPCLFGLFTLVVLLARQFHTPAIPIRRSAWYAKEEATFIDLLAVVRREIWRTQLLNWPTAVRTPHLANSPDHHDHALAALLEAACYAA